MIYYKALDDAYDYFTGNALIKNELLTPRERNTKFRYIADCKFKVVEISRSRTFRNFGVRFETKSPAV